MMSDLRGRVPGHSLIEELLRQWDLGTIRVSPDGSEVMIDDEAQGWFRGVLGERRVAEVLTTLDRDWTVLHSIPVGRGTSDIDHVVIGPPGVFTINTKYSPERDVWVAGYGMYVGGHKQHYVGNAVKEAQRAATYLSKVSGMVVPVTGIIVFVDPGRITVKATPAGGQYDPEIVVTSLRYLFQTLQRRREFSAEQIATIAAAAIRPATWHERPRPWAPGEHITQEFEALEAAVGTHVGAAIPVKARVAAQSRSASTTTKVRAAPRTRVSTGGTRKPRSRGSRSRKRSLLSELFRLGGSLIAFWIFYQVVLSMWTP